jgi:hypothetical protein
MEAIFKAIETKPDVAVLDYLESHRASAMRKLNLSSSTDLVHYAIRNKLVEA